MKIVNIIQLILAVILIILLAIAWEQKSRDTPQYNEKTGLWELMK